MPIVKGKTVEPADAMAAGLCPECGAELKDLDLEAHIQQHWPLNRSPEAVERIAMLRKHQTASAPQAAAKAE